MALVAIGTEHGGSHLLQEHLLYTHSTAVSPLLMAARACFSELYDGILSRALVPLLPVSRAASAGLSRRFCRSRAASADRARRCPAA